MRFYSHYQAAGLFFRPVNRHARCEFLISTVGIIFRQRNECIFSRCSAPGRISHQMFSLSIRRVRSFSSFSCFLITSVLLAPLFSLQKFYKEKFNREKGKSSYTNMKTLPEVEHAMEVNKNQSDVNTHTHTHT